MDRNVIKKEASAIARTLKEKKRNPFIQIQRLIEQKGIDFAREYLDKTLKIEADGGMMTHDGERRRTPGGVFFHLVKAALTPEERAIVFPTHWKRQKAKLKARQQARKAETPQAKAPVLELIPAESVPEAAPPGISSEPAGKLAQLEEAAQKLRERLREMEAKGQKGAKMTRSLLEQTERQIAKLRA